jgi:hypothetical protein
MPNARNVPDGLDDARRRGRLSGDRLSLFGIDAVRIDAVQGRPAFLGNLLQHRHGSQPKAHFLDEPEEDQDARDIGQDRHDEKNGVARVLGKVGKGYHCQAEGEGEQAGAEAQLPAAECEADQPGRCLAAGELDDQQESGEGVDDEGEHRGREGAHRGSQSLDVRGVEARPLRVGNEPQDELGKQPGTDRASDGNNQNEVLTNSCARYLVTHFIRVPRRPACPADPLPGRYCPM